MRWLLPLMVLLAFATAIATVSRNSTPSYGVALHQPAPRHGEFKEQHQPNAGLEHQAGQANNQAPQYRPFLVIQFNSAPNEHRGASKSQNESQWYASPDWWIAGFTGALFIATVLLWIFTALMWSATRRAVRDGQISSKAAIRTATAAERHAKIAEKTLTEHQRPWIFRDIVHLVWRNTPNVKFNDWWVSLKWKNIGQSPAMIRHFEYQFVDMEKLPDVPDYSKMMEVGVVPTLAQGDDFATQQVGIGGGGLKSDGTPTEFVLFGRLIYAEMNGREHYSGFALRLAPMGNAALECGGDAYNYYT